MAIKDYKELLIWKKGIELVKSVYKITRTFPREERFGLISQMQRAAVSIPVNIAEGFCRQYPKEYKQFLHIALGSCAELETLFIVAKSCDYIQDEVNLFLERINHESRMINRLSQLISFHERRATGD